MAVLSDDAHKRMILDQLNGSGRSGTTVVDIAARMGRIRGMASPATVPMPASSAPVPAPVPMPAIIGGISSSVRGSVTERLREKHARIFWVKGIGDALGYATFEEYLARHVPEIPDAFLDDPECESLVYCENALGFPGLADMMGIDLCGYAPGTFDDFGSLFVGIEPVRPHWFRAHDGSRERGCAAERFIRGRKTCQLPLTGTQGICLAIQYPDILTKWSAADHDTPAFILCGSIERSYHDFHPALLLERGVLRLGRVAGHIANQRYRIPYRLK